MLSLQQKPKLGHTKPSTGPHAAQGPRVGHSWLKQSKHQCLNSCNHNHIIMDIKDKTFLDSTLRSLR